MLHVTNTPLHQRAMLVSLHQRAWRAVATDRDLASQTEEGAGAESGTMKVIKELTPKGYIAPILQIMQIGRDEHLRLTLPGFIRGTQLLATAMYDRYERIQYDVREQFGFAVQRFIEIYPDIKKKAPIRLGDAYKEADFPTPQQLQSNFEYRIKFAPVPEVNDWRLDGLASNAEMKLRGEVEDEIRAMFNAATRSVYDRAHTALTNIAKQAENYQGGPGPSLLRDATIENLKELSEIICDMNVTGDPVLTKIGHEMVSAFSDLQGKELRKDEKQRGDVAAAAKRILALMGK